jgi:hypothetical protein
MDIHKPKPWHGVREFLKEYLIIVIGVLTALGAEAVVQNLHDARLAEEARQAVRDELNVDLTNMAMRFSRDACVIRRLDEIDALLDRAEAGGPFAPPGAVGGPRERALYTERWETAKSGGRLSLISSDEQRAFARAYGPLERARDLQQQELQVWLRLHALQGRRRLSPDMITVQRLAVTEARDLNALIHQSFNQGQFYALKIGVRGDARLQQPPVTATGGPEICQPLGALAPPSPGAR